MCHTARAVYNESVNWIFRLAECGVIALFLACVWHAWRLAERHGGNSKGDSVSQGQGLSVLLSAALFAWLFEDLNVLQATGRGAYSYHPRFVFLDQVPLFIVLAWAVILWTAMRLTDTMPLRLPARVAADATLAVLLDLSFDATAIRHFFWWWHGVGFDEAWFGVPAGNFFGWLLVALSFSGLTRGLDWLAHRKPSQSAPSRWRQWRPLLQLCVVPPLAFVLYRALESTVNFALQRAAWTSDRAALLAFFAVLFLIGASALCMPRPPVSTLPEGATAKSAAADGVSRKKQEAWCLWCRAAFHVFALVGLLVLPARGLTAAQKPAMLGIAGLVWALDWVYQKCLRFNR